MFCTECGKRMREGAIFCPYCGTKQGNSSSNPAANPKSADPGASHAPASRKSSPLFAAGPIILIAVLALVFYFVSTAYTCDVCEATYIGASYYDLGNGTMCKECAQDYWAPFPVENYKN